jgi:hypothetical protein
MNLQEKRAADKKAARVVMFEYKNKALSARILSDTKAIVYQGEAEIITINNPFGKMAQLNDRDLALQMVSHINYIMYTEKVKRAAAAKRN